MSLAELHIVVLAAGKGSRMRSALPKVLHQVAGKPLLAHVLDSARQLKPAVIHVVVGHGKDAIKQTFAEQNISWVEQTQQLGTGHAVLQALPNISDSARVLMLTADVPLISATTLASMCDSLDSVALALLTAQVSDPTGLGRILRDESDNVYGIVEQKDASAEQQLIEEINSGIMAARAKDLKEWLAAVRSDNAQQEYYLTDIVGIAHQQGNSIATFHPQQNHEVEGINDRAQLARVERVYQRREAQRLMASGVTIIDPKRLDIRGEVEIGTDTVIDINCVIQGPTKIGCNVSIGPNCVITDCQIDDGSVIHANCVLEQTIIGQNVNVGPFARLRPGTELGEGVRIGNFVETKNSKLGPGTKANHLSYIGDSQVGRNTNIGAGVITVNYDGAYKHQTTMGNNVFIGSNSSLVAPIKISDGATVGAGSTITSNVDADQLAVGRARQRQIDGWKRPSKNKQTKK